MGYEKGNETEAALVERARRGDARALEELLRGVSDWIYNVVRRVLLNPQESEDATQEVLVKIATNLAGYDARRASFRTWAYRVAMNHALNAKRGLMEEYITSFDAYGQGLRETPDLEVPASELDNPEAQLLIEETKASCTLGMLLCLDREQRVCLILADLMGLPDRESATLLGISHDAFRQRLSRARRDLYRFMDDECGLVNEKNPCRCSRKMMAFRDRGWIEAAAPRFSAPHLARLRAHVSALDGACEDYQRPEYREVFRDHPFFETPARILDEILSRFNPEWPA